MEHDGEASDVQDLKETELFYQIYSISPASIMVCTLEDRRFVAVNDGFPRLLGYEANEVLGKTVEDVGLMLQPMGEKQIFQAIEQGEVIRWKEARIETKQGDMRDVIGSFFPVEADGVEYMVQKLVDITPMRELQQQVLEASERERRRLARDLHDDIGQQLSGLTHLATTLERRLETEGSDETWYATQIKRELKKTTENTRRLSRGMNPSDVNEKGITAVLEQLADSAATVYNITCQLDVAHGIWVPPKAAEHLFRIAQEALNNAVRHGSADHVTITVTEEEERLILEIIDNGTGLPPDIKERDEGLGLSTMRYRARAMEGTLEIKRREGGGTMVRCAAAYENLS